MTSNFPGTMDMQHGLETDKHTEMRVEDERPARTLKPERLQARPATFSHTRGRHRGDRHCHSRRMVTLLGVGSTGHLPQPERNCGIPCRAAHFKKQYLGVTMEHLTSIPAEGTFQNQLTKLRICLSLSGFRMPEVNNS